MLRNYLRFCFISSTKRASHVHLLRAVNFIKKKKNVQEIHFPTSIDVEIAISQNNFKIKCPS